MVDIKKYDLVRDEENKVYQIRTKTDMFIIEFSDQEKEDIFKEIFDRIKKSSLYKFPEIIEKVKAKYDEKKIIDVIHQMKEYELIPENIPGISEEDSTDDFMKYLDKKITLLGDKKILKVLSDKYKLVGYHQIKTLPWDAGNDQIEAAVRDSDFIIAEAHHWNPYYIELINELAINYNKPWLLFGGVESGAIKIGPLFWSEESGCYECLKKRSYSQDAYQEYNKVYEASLRKDKQAAAPDTFLDSPILIDMAANLAILETGKFLSSWAVPETWKAYLLMDAYTYRTEKHTLLKVPYCEVCKPDLDYHLAPWLESVTLK